jgi:hypothetical protein
VWLRQLQLLVLVLVGVHGHGHGRESWRERDRQTQSKKRTKPLTSDVDDTSTTNLHRNPQSGTYFSAHALNIHNNLSHLSLCHSLSSLTFLFSVVALLSHIPSPSSNPSPVRLVLISVSPQQDPVDPHPKSSVNTHKHVNLYPYFLRLDTTHTICLSKA